MDTQLATNLVSSGLLIALFGLLAAVFTFGKTWLTNKTDQIKNTKVRNALNEIESAVESAVSLTAQKEADLLKADLGDGKLTEDEKAQMFQLAKDRAISFVTKDSLQLAKDNVQNFEGWLEALIEKNVRQDNAKQPAELSAVSGNAVGEIPPTTPAVNSGVTETPALGGD